VRKEVKMMRVKKRKSFKQLVRDKKKVILVSVGDAITARLIEEAGFDGVWVSGFEVSARLGLVDNGSVTMTEMLNASRTVVDATSLPVIVDVDNGYGGLHNFIRTVKEFERIGCAGICVEDNPFPKENSLWGGKIPLLSMREHGIKIRAGKELQRTKDFVIIARTEALIRGYGMAEAVKRAEHYTNSGADMVLIHSREPSGKEALAIPRHWKSRVPLVIVPTKFPHILNNQLFKSGFSVVVLANQMERVKIKAIRDALKVIKQHDSLLPIERRLSATLEDMRNLTPIKEVTEITQRYTANEKI
jgi:phosphoenolpyruvate phosphomutase